MADGPGEQVAVLQVQSISLRIDGETVLSDVSFAVRSELVAILGSGGAGKTMLFEILGGVKKPSAGRFNGQAAMVPELPPLRVASPGKRLRGPEAGKLLDMFGLWEVRERGGKELSTSQNAALALAEACAARPEVLLIDCALDVLPPFLAVRALGELQRIARLGSAVVFATRRAELAELAPRVVVLERGRVIADDEPHALAARLEGERIEVETLDPLTLRSLVKPWQVGVEDTSAGLRLTTPAGQEHVAELLRDGYGTVQATLYRPATLADAWERLRG